MTATIGRMGKGTIGIIMTGTTIMTMIEAVPGAL